MDEAKEYTGQEIVIGADRFDKFDSHHRNLRDLAVTHKQLVNNEEPDNYYLFELFPLDQPHSGILPRMTDLRKSYEEAQQLAEQNQDYDQAFDQEWHHEWKRTFDKDKPMMDQRIAAYDRLQEQRNRSKRATKLTSANVTTFLRQVTAAFRRQKQSHQAFRQLLQ